MFRESFDATSHSQSPKKIRNSHFSKRFVLDSSFNESWSTNDEANGDLS